MHKKTIPNKRLKEKRALREPRTSRMTILERSSDSECRVNGNVKSRSSSSWDRQTDQGSWSEDIEDVATRRSIELWEIVDRTLFDEDDQLQPGPLFDECSQWRNQLAHLRIVGRGRSSQKNGNDRLDASLKTTLQKTQDANELSSNLHNHFFSNELSIRSMTQQSHRQAKDEVLDHIVDFLCKELAEIEAEKAAADVDDDLPNNFDEFLKITPAPTTTGKNPLVSNNFYYNVDSGDTIVKKEKEKEKEKKKEKEKESTLQVGRNKLGTIFNERIIVSPVPFVVTTRESFTTLRRTPIQFLGEYQEVHSNIRSGTRREHSRRKLSLPRKPPLIAAPHMPSTWNTPVCPTVWPKNIKLTPIDTSRLPSSKRRPSKTAESIPRRNRNSLSPISRSVQPTSPRNPAHNGNIFEGLEVRGSHIEAQIPRLDNKIVKSKFASVKRLESQ